MANIKKMKRIIFSFIIGLFILSCSNKQGHNNNDRNTSEVTKKEFYFSQMKEKNFQLKNNGPCDDALRDSILERSIAYIDSQTLSDTNAIIEFKFIEACCQEFLGDYTIENDTIKFKFEQVNDEVCSCLCWYRYKLNINEPKENYKEITIEKK